MNAANFAVADNSHLVVRSCVACAWSMAGCRLMDCKMNLVELGCDCMDGGYNVNYTFAEAVAADNGDVMMKLVVEAVQVYSKHMHLKQRTRNNK